MQDFKADIIKPNTKGKVVFFSVTGLLAIVIIVLLILGIMPAIAPIFWIAIFIYGVARYLLQTRKQVLKKSVGKLIITKNTITAMDEYYLIDEVKSLRIEFYGWISYKRSADRSVPVTDMHAGDKNFISFLHNGEEKKFEIIITSMEHWQILRSHIIDWYRRGISIMESAQGMKSYGMEVLNYSQIQEFKKLIANPHTVK
jgi:hypothetical protein